MSLGIWVYSPREGSGDDRLESGLSQNHEMVIESGLDSLQRAWERFDRYSSRVNSLEEALRVADPEWLQDRVEARVYSVPINWKELFTSR